MHFVNKGKRGSKMAEIGFQPRHFLRVVHTSAILPQNENENTLTHKHRLKQKKKDCFIRWSDCKQCGTKGFGDMTMWTEAKLTDFPMCRRVLYRRGDTYIYIYIEYVQHFNSLHFSKNYVLCFLYLNVQVLKY